MFRKAVVLLLVHVEYLMCVTVYLRYLCPGLYWQTLCYEEYYSCKYLRGFIEVHLDYRY